MISKGEIEFIDLSTDIPSDKEITSVNVISSEKFYGNLLEKRRKINEENIIKTFESVIKVTQIIF